MSFIESIKNFIETYPTQIIIIMIIFIIILLIIIIIDLKDKKEKFASNKIITGTLIPYRYGTATWSNHNITLYIIESNNTDNEVAIFESGKIWSVNGNKINKNSKSITSELNDNEKFRLIFVNPYQFIVETKTKKDYWVNLGTDTLLKEKNMPHRYMFSLKKSDNTFYTYQELGIPKIDHENIFVYTDIEVYCPGKNICAHTIDWAKNFNNDNDSTKLHWWNERKHENGKFVIITEKGKCWLLRDYENKMYRWNIYGTASGCTDKANLKLHYNNNKDPENNEIFEMVWIDNDKLNLKNCDGYLGSANKSLKCNNYGGAEHNTDIYFGKNICPTPIQFVCYSYGNTTKTLTKSDFENIKVAGLSRIIQNVVNNKNKNTITFSDVEFRTPDNTKLSVHRYGDVNDYPNNTNKLQWYENVFNHDNSKYSIEYSNELNTFNVYRIINGIQYRWNIEGGCNTNTNKAQMIFYKSTSITPNANEQFKFHWLNNDTFEIKISCGGYIGGTVGHKQLIYSGNVNPFKFKMYSYNLNRYLNINDFGKALAINLEEIKLKETPITCNVKGITEKDKKEYHDIEFRTPLKDNLCIHKKGDINNFSTHITLHWWENSFNHANSNFNIIYNKLSDRYLIYDEYANSYYPWTIDNLTNKVNVKEKKMNIPFEMNNYNSFKLTWIDNETFIIKSSNDKNVGGVVAHENDIFAGNGVSETKYKMYSNDYKRYMTINDFGVKVNTKNDKVKEEIKTKDESKNKENKNKYFNIKYNAYGLDSDLNIISSTYLKPNDQFFKLDETNKNVLDAKTGKIIMKYKDFKFTPSTGKGTIILEKPLLGDGRYWRGTTPKTDESRIKKFYTTLPEMKHNITKMKNDLKIEVKEFNIVDAVEK